MTEADERALVEALCAAGLISAGTLANYIKFYCEDEQTSDD